MTEANPEVELELCVLSFTETIDDVIHKVFTRKDNSKLKNEIVTWKNAGSIPFSLLQRILQELNKDVTKPLFLHELLDGSELNLPAPRPLPRNPELVARLEKIKALALAREYKMMVKNVDSTAKPILFQLNAEVKATNRQLLVILNYILTVVGSFVFGYFAAYFANFDVTICVFMGLTFGLAVFFADLYFILRTDSQTLLLESKSQ